MNSAAANPQLEEQIAHWREYLRRRRAIHSRDVAELEDQHAAAWASAFVELAEK